MARRNLAIALGAFTLLAVAGAPTLAKSSPEEVARLGKDLTPVGAEKAGNKEGTIPAWDGGITKPPAGFKQGDYHPDPFAGEKPLYVIDKKNMAKYADQLTAGYKAMLEAYDTYFMKVYPTHRTAAAPQRIYDATIKNAPTAELISNGNGVKGAIHGIPFPTPHDGLEVIWNHILRWRVLAATREMAQAPVTRSGDYTLVKFNDEVYVQYANPDMTEEKLGNVVLFFKQELLSPPRLAGRLLLVHETLDQAAEARRAWVYNPGQRRVRRAPDVAFDNPREGSDGLMVSDQFDMWNGSPERYDWKLVGKKELIVPYNDYALHSNKLKYKDILTPLHVNPEHLRYELHRVWVVEATLKEGTRHIFKRRTFYVDEDSWQIVAVDQYDNRDQLWRVSEGFGINYYDIPTYWTTLEVHTDLQSGRYLALGLDNEYRMYDTSVTRTPDDYTPAALRREGTR